MDEQVHSTRLFLANPSLLLSDAFDGILPTSLHFVGGLSTGSDISKVEKWRKKLKVLWLRAAPGGCGNITIPDLPHCETVIFEGMSDLPDLHGLPSLKWIAAITEGPVDSIPSTPTSVPIAHFWNTQYRMNELSHWVARNGTP